MNATITPGFVSPVRLPQAQSGYLYGVDQCSVQVPMPLFPGSQEGVPNSLSRELGGEVSSDGEHLTTTFMFDVEEIVV